MTIKCPECHAGISELAESCMFCGNIMKEPQHPADSENRDLVILRIMSWIFFVIGFALFFSVSVSASPNDVITGISVILVVCGIMGITTYRIAIGKRTKKDLRHKLKKEASTKAINTKE